VIPPQAFPSTQSPITTYSTTNPMTTAQTFIPNQFPITTTNQAPVVTSQLPNANASQFSMMPTFQLVPSTQPTSYQYSIPHHNFCGNCGIRMEATSHFCRDCGAKQ